MHIAVAIVGFRNLGDILRCLEALACSTHSDFEVVICENGGPAAYDKLTSAAPVQLKGGQAVKKILAPRNLGYGGGVNVCLRESDSADCWWVLNPDTRPEPNAMAALAERLSMGGCEAAGGVVLFENGVVESYGGHWTAWSAATRSIGWGRALDEPIDLPAVERRLSYLSGASLMISRRFLDAVGPMREDYFLYCEEVEWFLRARARGMRLGFTPDARVLHYQGTTTGSVADIRKRPRMPVYLDTRNRLLVTRDRFPAFLPAAAIGVLVLLSLRCARRGALRQLSYVWSGWLAGLRDERGPPSWLET